MGGDEFQSYAVILSQEDGKNNVRVCHLAAPATPAAPGTDPSGRAKDLEVSQPLSDQDRVIDIFELAESLEPNFNIDDIKQVNKFEQIQRVIDGLLSFAHGVIQKDQKTRDRGKEPALTRHDAVPVFYVRQSGPGVALGAAVSLPAQIATAVHTSGYNASYRFRIDQHSTDKFPHGYTYTSIDEAKAAMKREFTPVFEATANCGKTGDVTCLKLHAWIQNRCFDFPIQTTEVKATLSSGKPLYERIWHLIQTYRCQQFHLTCPPEVQGLLAPQYFRNYQSPDRLTLTCVPSDSGRLALDRNLWLGSSPMLIPWDEGCLTISAKFRTRASEPATPVSDAAVGDVAVGDVAVGDVAVGDVAVGDVAVGDVAVGDVAGGGDADGGDVEGVPEVNVHTRYAIIVDAGSSGSRVYVYKWEAGGEEGPIRGVELIAMAKGHKLPNVGDLDQQLRNRVEANEKIMYPCITCPGGGTCWRKKGISEILLSEAGTGMQNRLRMGIAVRHHLEPLLDSAYREIATDTGLVLHLPFLRAAVHKHLKDLYQFISVFVGATGGMRELLQHHPARAGLIEGQAQAFLNNVRNSKNSQANYKTISGRVEGIFGWMAANYNYNQVDATFPALAPDDQEMARGCGYLELGGQTMQMAFDYTAPDNAALFRPVKIGNTTYNVVPYCWGDHGVNAAWNKHRGNLAAESPDNCLPSGVTVEVNDGHPGSGDFVECISECQKLMRPEVLGQPLALAPTNVKGWIGSANFYHGARAVLPGAPRPPPSDPITLILEAAKLHTGSPAQYLARHASLLDGDKEYFFRAVFNAVYTSAILHEGFGIKVAKAAEHDEIVGGAAEGPIRDFLNACVTDENVKTYRVIDPDTKPWAEGAALMYAHDPTQFGNLLGLNDN